MEQYLSSQHLNNEISLSDLIHIFWQKKWIIILTTVFFCLLSISYIFFTKPIYEAQLTLKAPTLRDVSFLNPNQFSYILTKSKVNTFNANEIFQIFGDVLESDSNKALFFKQVYLPSLTNKQKESVSPEQLFNNFSKQISVKVTEQIIPQGVLTKYIVSAKASSPEKAREWVKLYTELAKKKAITDLDQFIKLHNITLSKEINLFKDIEEKNKINRIAQLKESLEAIKASGLQNVSINLELYSNSKLQLLENKYNFYNQIKLSEQEINMFRFDGVINSFDIPIKLRATLILIFGVFLGLILGCFMALISHTSTKKNKNFN